MLKLGSNGPLVRELQSNLNHAGPTRLPRLPVDGDFGSLTMARTMEFQNEHGLEADGVAGPNTLHALSGASGSSSPRGRCIVVDLIHLKLTAFDNGVAELRIHPIHGGSRKNPSTRGVFQMSERRLRHHTSINYPDPPGNMDFSLFFHGVEAIHQGPADEPSHGCIHVNEGPAEQLFNWAGRHDIIVIVLKLEK
jgi:hypothetical protein